jgi:UPF0755 protein
MDEPNPPLSPRPSRGRIVARRLVAIVVLLAALGGAAWLGASALGGDDPAPPPATTAAAPVLKTLRIVFPEGFTRSQMAARVGEVRQIAVAKRKVRPKLTAAGYRAATRRIVPAKGFAKDVPQGNAEGFLFPALYDFTQRTTAKQLVAKQLGAFREAWSQIDLRRARAKNLTPYDVLIIASMVERETIAPEERRLVAAVIWNRLKARMPLGIDATIRYGLDVPGTEALKQSQLDSDNPYNTRKRPGLPSMQAAASPAAVPYLFFVRKPDRVHHFFTASESAFYAKACEYGFGCR